MMIRSMTAFGNARAESADGFLTLELRSVNSRYLDISFRLPDDLRMIEGSLRERLGRALSRGKVELRASFSRTRNLMATELDNDYLQRIARQLDSARTVLPETPAPTLSELIKGASNNESDALDPDVWTNLGLQALDHALTDMQANREREGRRLADMMLECAQGIEGIVLDVETVLPDLLKEHQAKLAGKLHEALETANPNGFAQISGAEMSARIAQEASLFSMRIDVAEEVSRLKSHLTELRDLLSDSADDKAAPKGGARQTSLGKRLDFLFQEMNREANTLGSKAAGIQVTRAAIDLKLLIEQMREQAQNLE